MTYYRKPPFSPGYSVITFIYFFLLYHPKLIKSGENLEKKLLFKKTT